MPHCLSEVNSCSGDFRDIPVYPGEKKHVFIPFPPFHFKCLLPLPCHFCYHPHVHSLPTITNKDTTTTIAASSLSFILPLPSPPAPPPPPPLLLLTSISPPLPLPNPAPPPGSQLCSCSYYMSHGPLLGIPPYKGKQETLYSQWGHGLLLPSFFFYPSAAHLYPLQ